MNLSISSSNYVHNGGLEFIDRYAAVAARRDRARRGPFPHYEREDVVQQVHLDLCALLGPDYPRVVLRAFAHGPGDGGGDDPAGPPVGYPGPIVDHATERAESLSRYGALG